MKKEKKLLQSVPEQAGTLGALLRLPYVKMQKRMYEQITREGFPDVRPAYSAVFRHIAPEGSRVTELAEAAQMTKQSMGYLVDALQERGYVELLPDPDDGRAKRVFLTKRGQEAIQRLIALGHDIEAEFAEQLGIAEFATLRQLLHRLNEVLWD